MTRKNIQKGTWLMLCVLPAVVLFLFVFRYSMPVPFEDRLLISLDWNGREDTAAMYRVNEHRMIVPGLFLTPLRLWLYPGEFIPVSSGHIRFYTWFSYLWGASNAILLALLIRRTTAKSIGPWSARWLILSATTLLFCLAAWENWEATGFAFFTTLSCMLGALLLLCRERIALRHIVWSGLLAFLATFSLGNGMVVWLAIPPLFLARAVTRRERIEWSFIWSLMATTAIGLYLLDDPLVRSPVRGIVQDGNVRIVDMVEYLLIILGRPLVWNWSPEITMAAGACVLAAFLFFLAQWRRRPELQPWLCLGAFGLGSVLIVTLSRFSMGQQFAFASRYVTLSIPVSIAVCVCLGLLLREQKRVAILAGVIAVLSTSITWSIHPHIANRWVAFRQAEACMQTYDIAAESCLAPLWHSDPAKARVFATWLHSLGQLRYFQLPDEHLRPLPHAQNGSFEKLVLSGSLMIASGWAVLPECRSADHIVLTLGQSMRFVAHTAAVIPRADLAAQQCRHSKGWLVPIDGRFLQEIDPAHLRAWVYDEKREGLLPLNDVRVSLTGKLLH